ncbi:LuxR family transcriptional regulator [Bradyrhizobium oligotrophicum S58]|uniref:LuxR family transcriptional regulator n=1 Tax=Bradyrhizobium oligotrophicum S58 TaxID=1245469 RepID=M4ZZR2_9BRAD|nr:LuxR C-terminal-related transcriptional regulator [Bradyrhizobium oligotrophicum]BAM92000.1 LuxR family transcriptional regulator [Bradyrhizobium oligotrophicum S58]
MIEVDQAASLASDLDARRVVQYLRRTGWSVDNSKIEGVVIASRQVSGAARSIRFPIPIDGGFGDQADRIADALRTLSAIERRPVSRIAVDIAGISDEEDSLFHSAERESVGSASRVIFLLAMEKSARDSLSGFLFSLGYDVRSFREEAELLDAFRRKAPACIVIASHHSGEPGSQIVRQLREANFPSPVITLSDAVGSIEAIVTFRRWARPYIHIFSSDERMESKLERAIESVVHGSAGQRHSVPQGELLTQREKEVLMELASGRSNKAIASALVMAERTVKLHVKNVLRKLHAKNRTEAAWFGNVLRWEKTTADELMQDNGRSSD